MLQYHKLENERLRPLCSSSGSSQHNRHSLVPRSLSPLTSLNVAIESTSSTLKVDFTGQIYHKGRGSSLSPTASSTQVQTRRDSPPAVPPSQTLTAMPMIHTIAETEELLATIFANSRPIVAMLVYSVIEA